jgi:hypothetical protein
MGEKLENVESFLMVCCEREGYVDTKNAYITLPFPTALLHISADLRKNFAAYFPHGPCMLGCTLDCTSGLW